MATITSYDSIYILPNLPDFGISGMAASEVCNVKISDDSTIIFDEDLTADSSGNIAITDLPSLLKEYFGDKMFKVFTFTVTYSDDTTASATALVMYSDAECDEFLTFITKHFLCPYDLKRTEPARKEILSFMLPEKTEEKSSVAVTVRAYYSDGSYKEFTAEPTEDTANSYENESWESESDGYHYVTFYNVSVESSNFLVDGKTLMRYVVKADNRTMEYEIDPEHERPSTVFLYKNSFGVWDYLYCNGKTETEDTFEREGAYINGKYRNYKVTEVKNFNCDTGILMPFEREMAQEILRSNTIFLCKDPKGTYEKWKEVVITDNDTSYTDQPDDLPRYTFVCRLAQKRHNVFDWQRYPTVFTTQYTETYE